MRRREGGQTAVEFALICSVLFLLVMGTVESGRLFFEFNGVSAAASYGARWASVVGGTCLDALQWSTKPTGNDWCNQWGNGGTTIADDFWNQAGNKPKQGNSTCPSSYIYPHPLPDPYYQVSSYYTGTATSVVGAVGQHFDTNSTSGKYGTTSPYDRGGFTPGFNRSDLWVCIQLNGATYSSSSWTVSAGDSVVVYVYAPATTTDSLDPIQHVNLVASSQYTVE
jgi:hypothetical protein